jgi:hypothetical protein
MAKNDVRIKSSGGLPAVPTTKYNVQKGATAIYAGEPVKFSWGAAQTPTNMVVKLADADGATINYVGIAATDSTQTTAADGYVEVYDNIPGVVLEAKCKTAASCNSTAEVEALIGTFLSWDLTGSTFTIDEATTPASTNSLLVVGGDPSNTTLWFKIRSVGR